MLVLGSYRIGPLTARNYITLLLGLYVVVNVKKITLDSNIKMYIGFIFLIVLLSFFNGDGYTSSFWILSIFARHIPSIITFLAIVLYAKSNDTSLIYKSLSILFFANAVITISQYYNNPIAWAISQTITPVDFSELEDRISGVATTTGLAVSGGLFGYAVANGYFLASYAPLTSISIWEKRTKSTFKGLSILLLSCFAAFATQERMALVVLMVYICIFLYTSRNNKKSSILLVLSILAIMWYFSSNDIDVGRFSMDQNNDDRKELFRAFELFMSSDFALVGGYVNYSHFGGGQHNCFLDSITRFGIVGGVYFVLLFYRVTKYLLASFRESLSLRQIKTTVLSVSCLLYMLYSLTHSTGLQSGDVMFWVLFALCFVECQPKCRV